MLVVKDFYSSGIGDCLVDIKNYPETIKNYLKGEEEFLDKMQNSFGRLVVVGCMDGLYLEWCRAKNKNYLGVDIVKRYVKKGADRLIAQKLPSSNYKIMFGSATEINEIIEQEEFCEKGPNLIFFPFNSFGNMDDVCAVVRSLSKLKDRFLICSYKTNIRTNKIRLDYYQKCGYQNIRCIHNERGVCFVSKEGLNTMAYNQRYLKGMFASFQVSIKIICFGQIGIAYSRM